MTTPTLATRLAAGLAALAAAAAVSACSTTATTAERDAGAPSSEAQAAAHNAADVMFAQMMIPHHQQALELSALVPTRSTNPAVIDLAASIAAQQRPEIDAMTAMLAQWEEPLTSHGDHSSHGGMKGMVDKATMERLGTLTGDQFDTLWLQSMISHHEGAVDMAQTEITDGKNTDMVGLARAIIDTQRAEIDQMTQLLKS